MYRVQNGLLKLFPMMVIYKNDYGKTLNVINKLKKLLSPMLLYTYKYRVLCWHWARRSGRTSQIPFFILSYYLDILLICYYSVTRYINLYTHTCILIREQNADTTPRLLQFLLHQRRLLNKINLLKFQTTKTGKHKIIFDFDLYVVYFIFKNIFNSLLLFNMLDIVHNNINKVIIFFSTKYNTSFLINYVFWLSTTKYFDVACTQGFAPEDSELVEKIYLTPNTKIGNNLKNNYNKNLLMLIVIQDIIMLHSSSKMKKLIQIIINKIEDESSRLINNKVTNIKA
ncbi:hypothetical protein AGLY_015572 [Aphis glycines]|uniref:Uncharacterized protein n=1 Tax=Aphis glycines TaxID=307491 RepID=A0A6G0T0P8_APHGL|nr:hypothetical protein AGLY_015572 [Aphis glycines]